MVLQYDIVVFALKVVPTTSFPPVMVTSMCVYPVRMIVAGYAVPMASTRVTRVVVNHSYWPLPSTMLRHSEVWGFVVVWIEVSVDLAPRGGGGMVLSTPRGTFPESVQ
jgi:hypothetical protein